MSMRLRSVCFGVAVAATFGANTHLADAAVIQGSFDGDIISGTDPTGLFGVVGQNLAGQPFSVNFTYDTSKFNNFQNNANSTFAFHFGSDDPGVHISFEINGNVETFDGNGFSGVQLNTGALILYSQLPLTFLQPNGVAGTVSHFILGLPSEVTGPQGNRVSLDVLNAVGAGGEGQLYLFSDVPNREFNIEAQVLVRNYSIGTAVPEPSTIALIGMALLSLFGFGLMRRRALAPVMLVAVSSMGFASSASASLLTPAYETQLSAWLGQGSLTFTNIYSAGTGDGNFNSFDWHSAVDGQGATFTLMEVPAGTYCYYFCPTIDQSIIGGYNPQSWNGALYNYNYTPADADRTAFIYNLSTNILFRQILSTDPDPAGAGQFQTFNSLFHGPTFGGGNDIYTNSNFLVNYLFSQSYGTSFTSNLLGTGNDPSYAHFLYGFPLAKLETYTFSTNDTDVPEPSTIAVIGMALLSLFGYGLMRRRADA